LKGVRRLAISADTRNKCKLFKYRSLKDFSLEELILVVDSETIREDDEAVFVEPRSQKEISIKKDLDLDASFPTWKREAEYYRWSYGNFRMIGTGK